MVCTRRSENHFLIICGIGTDGKCWNVHKSFLIKIMTLELYVFALSVFIVKFISFHFTSTASYPYTHKMLSKLYVRIRWRVRWTCVLLCYVAVTLFEHSTYIIPLWTNWSSSLQCIHGKQHNRVKLYNAPRLAPPKWIDFTVYVQFHSV